MTAKAADYSRRAGGAAIGARLRRLSERFDRETGRIYAAQGVDFEQRWYGILNQIVLNGPMTVGEIAAALRVTHVSVSQARRALEEAGLIKSFSDESDARKRRLELSKDGQVLVTQLAPLWQALNDSALELDAQVGGLVRMIDCVEDALEAHSLFDRVANRIGGLKEIG